MQVILIMKDGIKFRMDEEMWPINTKLAVIDGVPSAFKRTLSLCRANIILKGVTINIKGTTNINIFGFFKLLDYK